MSKRNTPQRRHAILALLNEQGEVSVDALARAFAALGHRVTVVEAEAAGAQTGQIMAAGAVLARDLNWCIRLGGNIYFLAKIGATDGKSFQQMAGSMTGMTEEEYRNMMIAGGRSVEGNRYIGENGSAQAQNQPQGAAGKKA